MAKLYKVMATGLNFREAASTDAEAIAVLPRNHIVEIIKSDQSTGWSQVRAQIFLLETEGFVATRFLVELNESPTLVVRGSVLAQTSWNSSHPMPGVQSSIRCPFRLISYWTRLDIDYP